MIHVKLKEYAVVANIPASALFDDKERKIAT